MQGLEAQGDEGHEGQEGQEGQEGNEGRQCRDGEEACAVGQTRIGFQGSQIFLVSKLHRGIPHHHHHHHQHHRRHHHHHHHHHHHLCCVFVACCVCGVIACLFCCVRFCCLTFRPVDVVPLFAQTFQAFRPFACVHFLLVFALFCVDWFLDQNSLVLNPLQFCVFVCVKVPSSYLV